LRTTFVILALAADTSLGQATDPLKSPGCVEALDALQAREAALLSAGTTHSAAARAPAALEPYRKRVARECLGKEDLVIERTPRPPITVSPVAQPPAAVPRARAVDPPPVQLPPLRTVTQCDPLRVLDERRRPPQPDRAVARRAARRVHRAKRRAHLSLGLRKAGRSP
jgi:hypothetical protein